MVSVGARRTASAAADLLFACQQTWGLYPPGAQQRMRETKPSIIALRGLQHSQECPGMGAVLSRAANATAARTLTR